MQQFKLYLEVKNLKICKPPLHCTWQAEKPLKCIKLSNGIKPFMARFETLETMLPEEDVFISQNNHWTIDYFVTEFCAINLVLHLNKQ